ncbi:hypothetical protein Plhal703r1_c06g0032441 [Plasmopara halstedii]
MSHRELKLASIHHASHRSSFESGLYTHHSNFPALHVPLCRRSNGVRTFQ